MADVIRSIDDLAGKWPSHSDFAREAGIKPSHFQTMRARSSIPVDYWPGVVAAARARRIDGIDYEALTLMHAKPVGAVLS